MVPDARPFGGMTSPMSVPRAGFAWKIESLPLESGVATETIVAAHTGPTSTGSGTDCENVVPPARAPSAFRECEAEDKRGFGPSMLRATPRQLQSAFLYVEGSTQRCRGLPPTTVLLHRPLSQSSST